MEDCIFCKIVKKEAFSRIVYEDEEILAFLDKSPLNPGHLLVVPKTHYQNVFEIEDKILERLILVTKKLAVHMKKVLNLDGINIMNSNGNAAEQSVPHFHIHIIPRRKGDNLELNSWWKKNVKQLNDNEFNQLTSKLKIDKLN